MVRRIETVAARAGARTASSISRVLPWLAEDHERANLRAENERLRAENERLRDENSGVISAQRDRIFELQRERAEQRERADRAEAQLREAMR